MRDFFILLVAVHGLVHIIGFLRAFELMKGKNYNIPVTKPMGLVWLLAFILFAITAFMIFDHNTNWWIIGSIAVIISQLLIIFHWNDSKYGTIPNILIIFVIIVDFGAWHFSTKFTELL